VNFKNYINYYIITANIIIKIKNINLFEISCLYLFLLFFDLLNPNNQFKTIFLKNMFKKKEKSNNGKILIKRHKKYFWYQNSMRVK
jgi:hypothetical protein